VTTQAAVNAAEIALYTVGGRERERLATLVNSSLRCASSEPAACEAIRRWRYEICAAP